MWIYYFLYGLVLANSLDIDDLLESTPKNEEKTSDKLRTAHLEPKLDIYFFGEKGKSQSDEKGTQKKHRGKVASDRYKSSLGRPKVFHLEPIEISQHKYMNSAEEQKVTPEDYGLRIRQINKKQTQKDPVDVKNIMDNITAINEALEKLLQNYESLQKIYKLEDQSSFENNNWSTEPSITSTSDPNAEIRTGMFFDEVEEEVITPKPSKITKNNVKNVRNVIKQEGAEKRSKPDSDNSSDIDDDDVLTLPLSHKSEIIFLKRHHSDDKNPNSNIQKFIFSRNMSDDEDEDKPGVTSDSNELKSIVTGNAIVNNTLLDGGNVYHRNISYDRRYNLPLKIEDANFAMSLVVDPKTGYEQELFKYSKNKDQSDSRRETPKRRFHEAHQQTLSLRDALGSACMKVYIRKCYKVIKSVQVDVCTSRKVCNVEFKKKLDKEARIQCIKTFESKDESQKQKNSNKNNKINNDNNGEDSDDDERKRAIDDEDIDDKNIDDETRSGTEAIFRALRGLLRIQSHKQGFRRNTHIHSLCFLADSEQNEEEIAEPEPEPESARSRIESLLLTYKIKRMTQGQNNNWEENAQTNQETNMYSDENARTNPETNMYRDEYTRTNPETNMYRDENARTNHKAYRNKHESFNQEYKTALTSSLQSLRGRYEMECRKAAAAKCMDACTQAFLEACSGICEPYSKIMYKHGKSCHKYCQDMFLYDKKDGSKSGSSSRSSSSDSSSSDSSSSD